MASRRILAFVLAGALASVGASYRTTNFVVEAPTPQIAQQMAIAAEQYRSLKAQEWLGREMPNWPQPCPIRVKVTMGGAGGATTFSFDGGRVQSQHMHIEGSLDRLLASVLPHEVTHTVFAHYFRQPVPRWADEGGAVLSEDDIERGRHDQLVRQLLNQGRAMPLKRLFGLREYPSDVMTLYAEGYSVAQFLVDSSSRPAFLAFVAQGMNNNIGWDRALQTCYRYNSVEELEQAWLSHLRSTKRAPAQLAQNTANGEQGQGVLVRQTLPPTQPVLSGPQPIVRGQSPAPIDDERYSNRTRPNYTYVPDVNPQPRRQDAWQPVGTSEALGSSRPVVVLGQPEFGPPPSPPPSPAFTPAPPPVNTPPPVVYQPPPQRKPY